MQVAAGDERREGGVDCSTVVAGDEQPVLPSYRESLFILPMSANAQSFTTGGIRSSAPRS
jgi:hypothetical protein